MTLNDILLMAGDIVILSALVPLVLFVVYYSRQSPWTLTDEGKNLMLQKVVLIALILVVIASLFLGDYPGRWLVRLTIYGAIVYVMWLDFFQLRRVQREFPFKRIPRSEEHAGR